MCNYHISLDIVFWSKALAQWTERCRGDQMLILLTLRLRCKERAKSSGPLLLHMMDDLPDRTHSQKFFAVPQRIAVLIFRQNSDEGHQAALLITKNPTNGWESSEAKVQMIWGPVWRDVWSQMLYSAMLPYLNISILFDLKKFLWQQQQKNHWYHADGGCFF